MNLNRLMDSMNLGLQIICKIYQGAIECFEKSIAINPQKDFALSNKDYALHNLKKYSDAIQYYDKLFSLKITPLRFQRKADSLML